MYWLFQFPCLLLIKSISSTLVDFVSTSVSSFGSLSLIREDMGTLKPGFPT